MTHEVVLYTRRHCGLCDEAAVELRAVANELGFAFAERDIDGDPVLLARYNTVIPVVAVNGVVVAEAPFLVEGLREMVAAEMRPPE